MKELEKLHSVCRAWGGELIPVSSEVFKHLHGDKLFFEAPFRQGLGILWRNKIVYAPDALWPEIIHEMGHVFCTHLIPNAADEWDFFGWEYQLAKQVGNVADWIESNRHYTTGLVVFEDQPIRKSYDFGWLDSHQQEQVLEERVAFAQRTGLLDADGNPLSLL